MAFFFFSAGATAMAQAFTPISNLDQTPGADDGIISGNSEQGMVFITGTNATILNSFSISLAGATNLFGRTLGPLNLYLYADAGGLPGTNLTAMVSSSSNSSPTDPGIYAYLPASPLLLQANSRYWIVANSSASGLGSEYLWHTTSLTNLDAGSTWVEGSSAINSGKWTAQAGLYYLFSVTVANLPSLAIAQPIVLTYTNVSFPFVLQQNGNLTTTNWVNVTNAILSGVLSNQVVFILPPSAPRLFYRLSGP